MPLTNKIGVLNGFPGGPQPVAFKFIVNEAGDGYVLSFDPDFNNLYPSNPATITPGLPLTLSPLLGATLLDTVDLVNLNTATAQTLYTCPAGVITIPTLFVIYNASVSLTTNSFSIGWNSTAFDNVYADDTHTELTTNLLYSLLFPKDGASQGVAADVLKLKNNILQGAAATCSIATYGFQLPA
jgi:hypothetical protein